MEVNEDDENPDWETASERLVKEFPELATYFKKLKEVLPEIIHDLDYYYSGDTDIADHKAFEDEALKKLSQLLEEKK